MRRYLRCPGAICCPARRAMRAVLQPHIRFCDELIVVDRAEHVGELLGLVGERLGSVLKHRLQHGEHRQGDLRLLALFRLRSTGLGVAVGAIRSCRGRHRPRASPRSPNGPTRARLKPPGSPAASRSSAFRPLEKKKVGSRTREIQLCESTRCPLTHVLCGTKAACGKRTADSRLPGARRGQTYSRQ